MRKLNRKQQPQWVCGFEFHSRVLISLIPRLAVIYIYIANFLKTNLTKFVVIWVKRRQRLGFSSPRSSKVTVTKEKERREEKAKRRKGGEEKSNACTPSFYNSYLGDFWPKKKPFHANGPFGDIWITWPSVRPSILSDVHYLLVSRGNILHSSAHAF